MRFLFVIDPLDGLNPETDTTIEIMRGCVAESIDIEYAELKDLYFFDGKVRVNSTLLEFTLEGKLKEGGKQENEIGEFDLVLMRKEPPYDLDYHYATMLLEKTDRLVLNNPQGLRDANEKLVILNFPTVIPQTLVTNDEKKILDFVKDRGQAVLKPIDLFGGKDVVLLEKKDKDMKKKIQKLITKQQHYVLVQEFIENAYEGDKRVLVLNGEPLGAIKRVPKKGDFRANMALGGVAEATHLTQDDLHVIKTIKPYLVDHGLVFAGVDIVDGKLIEINVTCPTGLVQVKEFENSEATAQIVEFFKEEIATQPDSEDGPDILQ